MRNILIVGATGLIGEALLSLLLAAPETERIYAPTRTALPAHDKLVNPVGSDLRQLLEGLTEPVDLAFCCLGTTRQAAGSKTAFHFVDYVLPLYSGLTALQLQAKHYLVVSALGANAGSPFLYSRIKGELEQALQAQRWPQLTIVRPSMLLGERRQKRWLESISAPLFSHLPLKWRSIEGTAVAQALWHYAQHSMPQQAMQIIESQQLQQPFSLASTPLPG
ncbi:MAG: hypothetical protein ACRC5A_06440 [Enterobacteriaceae bacterium]